MQWEYFMGFMMVWLRHQLLFLLWGGGIVPELSGAHVLTYEQGSVLEYCAPSLHDDTPLGGVYTTCWSQGKLEQLQIMILLSKRTFGIGL